jgi:hypothetical protein
LRPSDETATAEGDDEGHMLHPAAIAAIIAAPSIFLIFISFFADSVSFFCLISATP